MTTLEPAATTPTANGAGPAASLDLDALEREGTNPPPFTFRLNGHTYTMVDRQEIDWQDLLTAMRNPIAFIKFAMSAADHALFLAERVPLWKMDILIESYFKHFGIPLPGEATGSSGF